MKQLTGLDAALVITAEYDRLRDEAERYARSLHSAGSLVEYHEVTGVDHGYNIMSDATDVTRRTYDLMTERIAKATAA